NKTAVVLDKARKVIAKLEAHFAEYRCTSETLDPDALQAQTLSETTLNGLEFLLQHIETSQAVIATSQALLKEIAEKERHWANQPGHLIRCPMANTTEHTSLVPTWCQNTMTRRDPG